MVNSDSLIAKNKQRRYLIYFLIPTIALINILKDPEYVKNWYQKSHFGCIFLILFLGLLFLYFGFNLVDRRIKLKINKFGIWTLKYGQIDWNEIDAFHFQIKKDTKVFEELLWIEFKEYGVSKKIDISRLDKTSNEITLAIEKYSFKFGIRNSGRDYY